MARTAPHARTAPGTTRRHLQPRAAIIGGAALGLVVGATVYGAVSSSADAPLPQVSKARARVTVAPVIAPKCTGATRLENGVCVVHVVRTVVAPVAPAAPVAGQVPTRTLKPRATPLRAVAPKATVRATVAAKARATHAVRPTKAPVPATVEALDPAARTSPTTARTHAATAPAPARRVTAPAPGVTAKPTSTPVPTAAS